MQPIEINGRYRLHGMIGEGGMGAVYCGEHLAVGRPVAVKLVHAIHARNPQIVGRLTREARATAAIASENVVQVLDAGEDPQAGLFLVMELLTGEDLEQRLRREGRLSPEEAIRIADQAARGLGHAHARGVIHRDLKPANVFLCEREDAPSLVKIVDFGIAKLVHDASAPICAGNFTFGGCVVGTPQYMSPEQAQGLEDIDLRTDVYSLGALLFEMLVGRPPLPDFDNYEQRILHIVTAPRPRLRDVMPGVDPDLDALVAEMLASDRRARPRDMRTVRERLARLGRVAPRTAISAPPPPATVNREDARRLAWGAAAITAVAIGIVIVRALVAAPAPVARVTSHPEIVGAGQLEDAAVAAKRDAVAVAGAATEKFRATPKRAVTGASKRPSSFSMVARAPSAPAEPTIAPPPERPYVPAEPSPVRPYVPVEQPPAPPAELDRPFGGTGISQEF